MQHVHLVEPSLSDVDNSAQSEQLALLLEPLAAQLQLRLRGGGAEEKAAEDAEWRQSCTGMALSTLAAISRLVGRRPLHRRFQRQVSDAHGG